MKNKFITFYTLAQANWLALVIFMVIIMLCFVCRTMFSWLFGYWSNALIVTRFELNSCWTGVLAVITGLAGVAALAKTAWTKYLADSQFNLEMGKPIEQTGKIIRGDMR